MATPTQVRILLPPSSLWRPWWLDAGAGRVASPAGVQGRTSSRRLPRPRGARRGRPGCAGAAARQPAALATCFWEGPISTERRAPAASTGATSTSPRSRPRTGSPASGSRRAPGSCCEGRYAHARYQSLNAYSDGAPTDALPDLRMQPDPGSTNPFIAGNRRDLPRRAYTVNGARRAPPAERPARPQHPLRRRRRGATRSSSSTGSTSPTAAATSPATPACRSPSSP